MPAEGFGSGCLRDLRVCGQDLAEGFEPLGSGLQNEARAERGEIRGWMPRVTSVPVDE